MDDKSKRKNDFNPQPYWRVLIPIMVVLIIGIWFPVRTLLLWELNYLLYGGIVLGCVVAILRLWRYRNSTDLLMSVIFLCGVLASVQLGYSAMRPPHTYPPDSSTVCRDAGEWRWDAEAWESEGGLACHFYVDRGCFIDVERYLGTHLIAIHTGESYRRLICE